MSSSGSQPVNVVAGDAGFISAHGRAPTPDDGEVDRIRAHLEYVIDVLAAGTPTVVDGAQRARRESLLERLRAYAEAGVFPGNRYVAGRRPVFEDGDGRLCAVGWLIAESAGRAVADGLAERQRLVYLGELTGADAGLVDSWAATNGFVRDELALIQPTYDVPLQISYAIYFDYGAASPQPHKEALLDGVVEVLKDHPEVRLVRVTGHADNAGSKDAGVALSQRRAEVVMAYLVAHGIDAKRLVAKGLGATSPACRDPSRACRAMNRRVSFDFIDVGERPLPPPREPGDVR